MCWQTNRESLWYELLVMPHSCNFNYLQMRMASRSISRNYDPMSQLFGGQYPLDRCKHQKISVCEGESLTSLHPKSQANLCLLFFPVSVNIITVYPSFSH